MAQTWPATYPIAGSRLVSAFRGDFNEVTDSLVTCHSGSSEPAQKFPLMLWADLSAGLLKQRNAANTAWKILAALDVDYGGSLPRGGTTGTPMTGLIDMGGFTITNLGAGSGNGAARVSDLAAYVKLDGTTAFTGIPSLPASDPSLANHAARKSYVDAKALAGGSFTGQVTLPSPAGAGSNQAVRQVDFESKIATHVHNGSAGMGPKVDFANLDAPGVGVEGYVPMSLGSNTLGLRKVVKQPLVFLNDCPEIITASADTGWTTYDASSAVVPGTYAVLLQVTMTRTGTPGQPQSSIFEFRKPGTTPVNPQKLSFTISGTEDGTYTGITWAELDVSPRTFQYRFTNNSTETVSVRLLGYMLPSYTV